MARSAPRTQLARALSLACGAAALATLIGTVACAPGDALDPSLRTSAIVDALVTADLRELRGRPTLVAGKYARMARSLYDFYRGSMPLFRADVAAGTLPIARSRFALAGAYPLSLGDAHPENFGLLEDARGELALEPNDFDAADRYPYQLDLRRLTVGLVVAARLADDAAPDDAPVDASVVARAALDAYVATHHAIDEGRYLRAPLAADASDAISADLARRATRDRDARAELDELTRVDADGRRTFLRGAPDASDPENTLADLPDFAVDALPATLDAYARSLPAAPPEGALTVLDAVRVFGSGVASWPRVRVYVLVRGASDALDDDIVLELKEETQSGATGVLEPGVFGGSEPERIASAARATWSSPATEPWFGTATWLGIPVQIRREAASQKTFRTSRLEGDRATTEALAALARREGELLARMQGTDALGSAAFSTALVHRLAADEAAFVDDELAIALAHADVVELDWQLFRDALLSRGPTLGFTRSPSDAAPSASWAALYGTPPPIEPWN